MRVSWLATIALIAAVAGCASPCPPPRVIEAPPLTRAATTRSLYAQLSRLDGRRCPFGHDDLSDVPQLPNGITGSRDLASSIVCLRCGYGQTAGQPTWEKGSTDPLAFLAVLDPLITQFPLLSPDSKPQYRQTVLGTRPTRESLLYRSTDDPASLEAQLSTYLAQHHLNASRQATGASTILTATTRCATLHIEVTRPPASGATTVLCEMTFP